MRIFKKILNSLTVTFLGINIFHFFDKVEKSKEAVKKANQCIVNKQLFQAINIASDTLAQWPLSPSFFESILRKWAMGNLLEKLEVKLKNWQEKVVEIRQMANQAACLEVDNNDNLVNQDNLLQALQLYLQCSRSIYNPDYINAITRLEQKLEAREKYKQLMREGQNRVQSNFFKEALLIFTEAQKLFLTQEVEEKIILCQLESYKEKQYEQSLNQANQLATIGRFSQALTLLRETLAEFSRSDGEELLSKIEKVLAAKKDFQAGIQAEKLGHLGLAKDHYEKALVKLPEFTDCRIRLGIVALKNNEPSLTLSSLEGISGEQTAYIRGLAYIYQGNWRQAKREWKTINHRSIEQQRQKLKALVQQEKLLTLKKIETLIDNEDLENAQLTSLAFLDKFGSDSLVEINLNEHILPRLEGQRWQSDDWPQIAKITEEDWLKKQDIISLHNWAIASYYHAQIDTHKLENCIISWSTAIANLQLNPSLKEVPWLGNTPIDLKETSSQLIQLLEKLIEPFKDTDIEEYFKLRDIYRLELVVLRLMNESPCGVRVKQLLITPGCYQRYRHQLPKMTFPAKLWGALYTDWGLAVAACVEGDIPRAVQIKPRLNCSSEAENFADSWVSYHEGCYYFRNDDWRRAIRPLKAAKAQIQACLEWIEEIEELCQIQRRKIAEFSEHLMLSEFWHELIGSQAAKAYLAECQADIIREQLTNQTMELTQAVNQLRNLLKIDPNNPIVLQLIAQVEIIQELEIIDYFMQNNQWENAVSIAQASRHYETRYRVAQTLIGILVQRGNILAPEVIMQLGLWAKELCPNEPAFQQVYYTLGLY